MNLNDTVALSSIRSQFPILNDGAPLCYLDNAATTLKPQVVIDALMGYYTQYSANVHRGLYPISMRASEQYEDARTVVKEFLSADDTYEVIFTAGVTDSINLVANGDTRDDFRGYTVSEMDHHSSYVPWQQKAKHTGKPFYVIPVNSNGELDMDVAQDYISKSAVLSIIGMSNVTGYIPHLQGLLSECQKHGTRMIVDAAQLAAHAPIDVSTLPIDAVAFSGHKLCGPTGVGVLCIKKEWLYSLAHVKTGGGTIKSVRKEHTEFLDTPEAYEAGTPHIAGVIGMSAALKFLMKFGFDAIQAIERHLRPLLLESVHEIPGARLIGNNEAEEGAIVSIVSDTLHSQDISFVFQQKNICVRTGHLCAQPLLHRFGVDFVLRFSCYFYNTVEEMALLKTVCASLQEFAQR